MQNLKCVCAVGLTIVRAKILYDIQSMQQTWEQFNTEKLKARVKYEARRIEI